MITRYTWYGFDLASTGRSTPRYLLHVTYTLKEATLECTLETDAKFTAVVGREHDEAGTIYRTRDLTWIFESHTEALDASIRLKRASVLPVHHSGIEEE